MLAHISIDLAIKQFKCKVLVCLALSYLLEQVRFLLLNNYARDI